MTFFMFDPNKSRAKLFWLTLYCAVAVTTICFPSAVIAELSSNPQANLEESIIEIPFAYPSRPTIYATICGETIPMLFDTGTKRSIILESCNTVFPQCLEFSSGNYEEAMADGKPTWMIDSGYLRYATSDDVVLGNSSPLTMQFRIYNLENTTKDFGGAISPLAFADTHITEILNSESRIRLTPRDQWIPTDHSSRYPLKFPMKVTNEGIFLRLWIENEAYWFQFDTGFSGEMAVTPESGLGFESTEVLNGKQLFEGWGDPFELQRWSLDDQRISFLYDYSPGDTHFPSEFISSCYILPRKFLQELASFEVSGIVGGSFLREHSYALDISAETIYLSLGVHFSVPSGNPYPILPGYRNE